MPLDNQGPKEAAHYIEELERFAPQIADWNASAVNGDNAGTLRDLIGAIDKIAKQAEKDRRALKEPYLEQGRKIDASFKPVAAKAIDLLAPLKSALSSFLAAEEKRKREEAEAARREAEQKAAIAAKMAEDEFVGDFAKEKAEEAEKQARYAELMAEQNSVKGDSSDRAMGLRTYRKARVVNAAMLVGHYAANKEVIALCEKLANAEIRAAKGEPVSIPGIEVAEERKVA